MRQRLSMVKQFFLKSDDMPMPRHPVSTMWTLWIISLIVLFDIVFPDEIGCQSTIAIYFVAGIVPSIWAFYDQNYVQTKLKKQVKSLFVYLYRVNLFWMVFGTVMQAISYWGTIEAPFLAKGCVFLSLWFLSIPLVLIYNPWRWGIWAAAIFLGTIAYKLFLDWYLKYWHTISFIYLFLTIGIVCISAVISCNISCNKIKKLFS